MLSFLNFAVMVFASGGESGGPLDVNPGVIIWTVITFLFLLFVLKKFAWKPILGSLDERENFIKDSIAKAEHARDEAERLLEENQATLAKAEEESQKIITQGREYSEKLKTQILEESKEEARKMIVNATAEIERKNKEAFTKLKDQVADIAVLAAEKIIMENLDKDKQTKLVEKYFKRFPRNYMSEFQISTRYAAALMGIAEEKGIEEKVAEDIGSLFSTLSQSKELRTILASPVIKPDKKEAILKELFQNRVDEIVFNFILLVVEKNREEILFDITKRFIELRDRKYGFANAQIKSKVDFTDPQKKELLEKLEKYFQKKIRATFSLDENLIGGFVVRVGDTVINTSVKRKLELLKKKFHEESFLNN